jgi:hypothetical protein
MTVEEPTKTVDTQVDSKAASNEIVTEHSQTVEEVEETVQEVKEAKSNTEIVDDGLAEDQREVSSSHFGALCTEEELLIREGIHRGFIPGLEDQPCCAAEEAVRTWFYNAEEGMLNAGPENLLPFDEVEEKTPDTPANKWFFW